MEGVVREKVLQGLDYLPGPFFFTQAGLLGSEHVNVVRNVVQRRVERSTAATAQDPRRQVVGRQRVS